MALNREKVVASAQKFIQRGQLDKAIKEFQRIVEEDPKDVRTLLKIGDLFSKKGERDQAIATYLKVAEFYSEQGFFLKAVAVYKQILKVDPSLIDVNVKLADLYGQLGLGSDALSQYQNVAVFFEKAGQTQKTLQVLRKMVDLDPVNVGIRIKLAEMLAKENMLPDALSEFNQAAKVLKEQQRTSDYAKVCERVLFLEPQNISLAKELAELYMQQDDVKRALAKLQVCFKADPRDVPVLEMLAQAFAALGQTPKTVTVYRELANIHAEKGDYDKRRVYLRKILELAPEDEQTRNELELRASDNGERIGEAAPKEAKPPERGGTATPLLKPQEMISKLLTETDVYVKYGLKDKALEHLKKIFSLAPNNIEALSKVKEIYLQSGDTEGAVTTLMRMVTIAEDDGQAEHTTPWLREVLKLTPTHHEAQTKLKLLGEEPEEAEEILEADTLEPDPDAAVDDELAEADDVDDAAAGAEMPALPPDGDDEDTGADQESPSAPQTKPADDDEEEGVELVMEPADSVDRLADDHPGELELENRPATGPVKAESLPELEEDDTFSRPAVQAGESSISPTPRVLQSGESQAPAFDDDLFSKPGADLSDPPPKSAFDGDMDDEITGPGDPPADRHPAAFGDEDDALKPAVTVAAASAEAAEDELADDEPPLVDELEEADFFEQQGLTDEAIDAYKVILRKAPKNAVARERLKALGQDVPDAAPATPAAKPAAAAPAKPVAPEAKPTPPPPVVKPAVVKEVVKEPEAEDEHKAPAVDTGKVTPISRAPSVAAKPAASTVAPAKPAAAAVASAQPKVGGVTKSLVNEAALGGDAIDLASELADDIAEMGGTEEDTAAASQELQFSVEDVLGEFKKGVAATVDDADYATHYDLAIAYKEMGLTEEALRELGISAAAPEKEVDSWAMIGTCHVELGDHKAAIDAFKKAANSDRASPQQQVAVQYELANAYELSGDVSTAKTLFAKVAKLDPKFRDASARASGTAPATPPPASDAAKKGKISYL